MKPRLVALLLMLVLAPLLSATLLGLRTARDEQKLLRHQFQALLGKRLADVDARIGRVLADRQQRLARLVDRVREAGAVGGPYLFDNRPLAAAPIRDLVRGEPLVLQIFVQDAQGKLLHPPPEAANRNQAEQAFFERIRPIRERGETFFHPADSQAAAGVAEEGWYTYYLNEGVNFLFWRRYPGRELVGVEVDRLALLAGIVGELPQTDPADAAQAETSIRLLDTKGKPVYLWGRYQPPEDERPASTRSLGPPLGAFRLHYHASPAALGRGMERKARFGILAGVAALALSVIGLAIYFLREAGRETREAEQRVTFVNQVSHELKTPLTNIRMYAELLQDTIDEQDATARSYLEVIVAESQRLSRLIGNVLSFARQGRRTLSIHPTSGRIDQAIRGVVDGFRPGLQNAGIGVEFDLELDALSRFDADALGQMVGNLIGNVEKYAASGRWLKVTSRRRGEMVRVIVSDRGPGITAAEKERIFLPFYRLSSRTTDGVAGAGIGLSIARDLARLHGGGLEMEPCERGAVFVLDIHAPLESGE